MDSPGPSSYSPSQPQLRMEGSSHPSSTGTLRTKISLARGNTSLVMPFHLMKSELPSKIVMGLTACAASIELSSRMHGRVYVVRLNKNTRGVLKRYAGHLFICHIYA